MRKLALDFQRAPRPSLGGWLLLAAGLAVFAGLLYAQWQQSRERQDLAERSARVQAQGHGANLAGADSADDPALVAARQLLERSRLPWGALFSALESVNTGDIALLAVTPDVARRQVKIHAEARNLDAMLLFHRQLQQQAALGQVALLDHTVAKDAAETPVRFHVLANWGGSHAHP
jgi:hypothetical protein